MSFHVISLNRHCRKTMSNANLIVFFHTGTIMTNYSYLCRHHIKTTNATPMKRLGLIWQFIKKHKYAIILIAFGVNIVFTDDNNLILRAKNRYEISTLKSEIARYNSEYENTTRLLKELTENSDETIEKIAREKYLMKKENEDIYIFK